MTAHLWFDWLAYVVSALVYRKYFYQKSMLPKGERRWYYYTVAIVGFVTGAIGLSMLNTMLSLGKGWMIGKSVLGAIFGVVVAIEIYKRITHIKGSTGAYFVPSLALGIAIGRIGCFVTGLDDYTYGTATTLPWGVDFGDGIFRHPVQLYESVTMFVFFFYAMAVYKKDREKFEKSIFYIFIFVYATQRFVWEFLKPYAEVALGLNIFQWVCLMLIGYAIYHYKGVRYGTLFTKV